MASSISGKAFDLSLFKRVMRYVGPYRTVFILTSVLTIVLAVLSPIRPLLIQYAVDNFIVIPDPSNLFRITILMIILLILEAIFQFLQAYLANWIGQSVIRDIRVQVFQKITGFRLRFIDQTPLGTLVTRVISDIETIADIFSQGVLIIIGDILKLIVVIIFMFVTDWKLALFSMAPVPVLLVATNIFKNYIKRAFQDVRTAVAELNTFVQEHLTGMIIVKAFAKERREYKRFTDINKRHRDAHIRTVWANSIFFPVVEILSAVSIALLVWWGAGEVLKEHTTVGSLMAFILYIYMLYRPIRQLADRFNILQMGMVSSERVFKLIDKDENIKQYGATRISRLKGEINFKDVWFAYSNEDWILKNINFNVEAGSTIAFVGSTGAGKTTIINLIGRFYEFQKGQISIDNADIRSYQRTDLRTAIGIVLQDVFLFSDTIFNNITLGDASITLETVRNAAKKVGADKFINRLPGGYDFNVGERGGMLSSGQRQLIAFIRAYVYNPSVLILDEATSSIDSETERLIQQAIDVLTENRTALIIAHRLATVKKADKIIVLDKGEIIEEGSHSELIKLEGAYQKLFELQFDGDLS
ncbi:MAG TPA: antibiotic ABC transporter ATP-binding protein [Flavobacteriales bacterium]|jgi:ATP-binding cassette subfamily B multidrug efflux pump|nr:antibiotic ABC transporter ATP-binding protein [Flavobacteriales bacterium]